MVATFLTLSNKYFVFDFKNDLKLKNIKKRTSSVLLDKTLINVNNCFQYSVVTCTKVLEMNNVKMFVLGFLLVLTMIKPSILSLQECSMPPGHRSSFHPEVETWLERVVVLSIYPLSVSFKFNLKPWKSGNKKGTDYVVTSGLFRNCFDLKFIQFNCRIWSWPFPSL
jgi:hypothetical protein